MPQTAAAHPRYVGFWPRFAAFLVDTLVVLPLLVGAMVALYQHQGNWLTMLTAGSENLWLNYGLPALFTLLFWLVKSATPGKMIARAVIVDAETLKKPTPAQLLLRYLGYYLSLLPLGLGFAWIGWDRRKQGWHDKLAGTVVVERPAEGGERNTADG